MARRAIAALFPTTNQAYDAATSIKSLADEGKLEVKGAAIVAKDSKGNVSALDRDDSRWPWGIIGGPIVGGLIGLLAGPVGAVAGALVGGVIGWTADLVSIGLDDDFLSSVTAALEPGMTALVAEIDEGSTEAVDRAVAMNGGRIYRTGIG